MRQNNKTIENGVAPFVQRTHAAGVHPQSPSPSFPSFHPAPPHPHLQQGWLPVHHVQQRVEGAAALAQARVEGLCIVQLQHTRWGRQGRVLGLNLNEANSRCGRYNGLDEDSGCAAEWG